MSKAATTELVPFQDRFKLALAGGAEFGELLRLNLGGEEVRATEVLDRIKVPTGGGKFWSVPSLDGEKAEKTLEGVIIFTDRRRGYWADKNSKIPTCSSVDCLTGIGDPGGDCVTCPLGGKGAWGTGVKQDGSPSRGKACKEMRRLFFLMPGSKLPALIVAPPTSLRSLRDYLLLLNKQGMPYFGAVTRLNISVKPIEGNDVAIIEPSFVQSLAPEEREAILGYARSLQTVFASTEASEEEHIDE